MSCVLQNIYPPTPHTARQLCTPPPPRLCCGGRAHSLGGEGGGRSIFRKTQDTALYSTYIESSLSLPLTHSLPLSLSSQQRIGEVRSAFRYSWCASASVLTVWQRPKKLGASHFPCRTTLRNSAQQNSLALCPPLKKYCIFSSRKWIRIPVTNFLTVSTCCKLPNHKKSHQCQRHYQHIDQQYKQRLDLIFRWRQVVVAKIYHLAYTSKWALVRILLQRINCTLKRV